MSQKILRHSSVLSLTFWVSALSGCVLARPSGAELVLRGSQAEEREQVRLSPILLARQDTAEKRFFGFSGGDEGAKDTGEKNSGQAQIQKLSAEGKMLPLTSFDSRPGDVFRSVALLWPVKGGRITSPFGMRRGRLHAGIDIGVARGTPIRASLSGQVLISSVRRAYGQVVVIGHAHDHQTLYAHMIRRAVRSGDYVDRGEIIGYVGRTGRATGYHLHFETRVSGGVPQDPMRFLPERNRRVSGVEALTMTGAY